MKKLFIDGEYGTTGLEIRQRLALRSDIALIALDEGDRHNRAMRLDHILSADIALLCLPDDASLSMIAALPVSCSTRIIDSSTAHRIHPDWVYGFPEMTKGQRETIRSAQFVSNPGCYPTGAIALLRPLREKGILSDHYPITIHAVSGYTGGGKQLIARMTKPEQQDFIHASYFLYGHRFQHKHVPEIQYYSMLTEPPIFTPNVANFPRGMLVHVPLYQRLLTSGITTQHIHDIFVEHYQDQKKVTICSLEDVALRERLEPEELCGSDEMKILISGNDRLGVVSLYALLDNLGKGAAGAAIQNLDIMLD